MGHALTKALRDGDAIFHLDIRERDEGHHVGRADARMRARVLVEVDQLGRGLDGAEGGLFHRFGRARKGDHRAVVVEVGGTVEQARAFHGGDGGHDLVYHLGAAGFGEIGDTFNKGSRHGVLSLVVVRLVVFGRAGVIIRDWAWKDKGN